MDANIAANESMKPKFNLDDLIPSITAEMKKQMADAAISAVSYEVKSAMAAALKQYIQAEIVPALMEDLKTMNEDLRAAFAAAAKAAIMATAEKMVESAKTKLSGWEGDQLVREWFGRIFSKPDAT